MKTLIVARNRGAVKMMMNGIIISVLAKMPSARSRSVNTT
jgi:hypothetical protein